MWYISYLIFQHCHCGSVVSELTKHNVATTLGISIIVVNVIVGVVLVITTDADTTTTTSSGMWVAMHFYLMMVKLYVRFCCSHFR